MENLNIKKTNSFKQDIPKNTRITLLKYFKANGCTRATLDQLIEGRRTKKKEIFDYICNGYVKSEVLVKQECDSDSFNNTNQWLELMKASQVPNYCEYEAAAVISAIAQDDSQPEPNVLNRIDLKSAYGFLERALTGQPQKKLDVPTESFLCNEFKLLITEANSEFSDDLSRRIGQNLFERQEYNYEAQPHKRSLDPLFLDEI